MSSSGLTYQTSESVLSSQRVPWRSFAASLVVIDALVLLVAFVLAYWLRFEFGIAIKEVTPIVDDYVRLVALTIPAWLTIFAIMRLYDRQVLLGGTEEYMLVFNACTTGVIFLLFLGFFEEEIVYSRAWLVLAWMLAILLICIDRMVVRRLAYRLRVKGYFVVPAVIVGTNEEAILLAEQLRESRYSGLTVRGLVATDSELSTNIATGLPEGMSVLGSMDEIAQIVRKYGIAEVIVATTALHRSQLLDIFNSVALLDKTELRLSSGLYEVLTTGMQVNTVGSVPLMSMNKVRLDRTEIMLKSCLDYVMAIWVLVVLSPVLLAIAVLIRLDSPGPIIYRRRVLGMGRKQFDAFKFRTMAVNGDEILEEHPEFKLLLAENHKLKDDPRITRIGSWLRKTSLDELPQLLNVLLGQMSLVGPRMITAGEAEEYGPMRYNLLTVKPGLTGMWQVSGRSDLSYEDRVRLDMYYIRNYSIWLDLQLLFVQTPVAVLRGEGAY